MFSSFAVSEFRRLKCSQAEYWRRPTCVLVFVLSKFIVPERCRSAPAAVTFPCRLMTKCQIIQAGSLI